MFYNFILEEVWFWKERVVKMVLDISSVLCHMYPTEQEPKKCGSEKNG